MSGHAEYVCRERKSYLLPRQTRTKHRETDTGNKETMVNQWYNYILLKHIFEAAKLYPKCDIPNCHVLSNFH